MDKATTTKARDEAQEPRCAAMETPVGPEVELEDDGGPASRFRHQVHLLEAEVRKAVAARDEEAAGRGQWRDRANLAYRRCDELEAGRNRDAEVLGKAAERIADLEAKLTAELSGPTGCAYCGEDVCNRLAPDALEKVRAHLKACDKHPLRDVEAERDRLLGVIRNVEGSLDQVKAPRGLPLPAGDGPVALGHPLELGVAGRVLALAAERDGARAALEAVFKTASIPATRWVDTGDPLGRDDEVLIPVAERANMLLAELAEARSERDRPTIVPSAIDIRPLNQIAGLSCDILVVDDPTYDAATKALNDIAEICGCAKWEYPGQVVRDVEQLDGGLRLEKANRINAENEKAEALDQKAALGAELNRTREQLEASKKLVNDIGRVFGLTEPGSYIVERARNVVGELAREQAAHRAHEFGQTRVQANLDKLRIDVGRLLSPSWRTEANQNHDSALRVVDEMQDHAREVLGDKNPATDLEEAHRELWAMRKACEAAGHVRSQPSGVRGILTITACVVCGKVLDGYGCGRRGK